MTIAFLLLAAAILAAFFEPARLANLPRMPVWQLFFIPATLAATLSGVVDATVSVLILLPMLANHGFSRQQSALKSRMLKGLALIICLMLALHQIPGFHNLLLLDQVKLRPDAAPFTLYANFDKGVAGLMLLVWGTRRSKSIANLISGLRNNSLPLAAAPIATLGLAWSMGLIRLDPAMPAITPIFLGVNLLFTCVAEEAFSAAGFSVDSRASGTISAGENGPPFWSGRPCLAWHIWRVDGITR